jgi:cell division septal protein FtsQ
MLNRKMQKAKKIISLVVGVGFVAVVMFFAFSRTFSIQQIFCAVNGQSCSDPFLLTTQALKNQSLFFANFDEVRQKISSLDPSLESIEVEKHLPNTVKIIIHDVPVIYGLKSANASTIFLFNQLGNIAAQTETTTLPTLEVPDETYDRLIDKKPLDPQLHQQFSIFVVALQQKKISPQSVRIFSSTDSNTLDEIEMHLDQNRTARLRLDQASDEVEKLRALLDSLDFSSFKEPVKVIDLRFKFPVLEPV